MFWQETDDQSDWRGFQKEIIYKVVGGLRKINKEYKNPEIGNLGKLLQPLEQWAGTIYKNATWGLPSVRRINTPNLSFFPPSVLLPVPPSGWSQRKVRGHGGQMRWSTDISLPRHGAGSRRVGSRSGGTNKQTKFYTIVINNSLCMK